MTYKETLDWMFVQLPMYQRQGGTNYKIDLSKTIALANHLNHPEQQFKSIHVAGTNGKGSTSHMLASILRESDYSVGLYTSPHLKDFRERIRLNGIPVDQDFVIDFVHENRNYFEKHQLSFFEMTVGMAFDYFAKNKVDIAVIEVGLGGRLDSTNIINPEISVITNIGLDHTRFLGETLSEIATEKGGIIKPDVPVVIGSTTPETEIVFKTLTAKHKSQLYEATHYNGVLYPSDLKGVYQNENIRTALQTIKVLQDRGWKIGDEHIRDGLLSVVRNTGLLGRWQLLQENPRVICDTGHNAEGLRQVFAQLAQETYRQLHLVIGVVDDKDLDSILPLFPKNATYYYAKPAIPRGLDALILKEKAKEYGLVGSSYPTVQKAYKASLQKAQMADLVFIGGSTFVVAEVV